MRFLNNMHILISARRIK